MPYHASAYLEFNSVARVNWSSASPGLNVIWTQIHRSLQVRKCRPRIVELEIVESGYDVGTEQIRMLQEYLVKACNSFLRLSCKVQHNAEIDLCFGEIRLYCKYLSIQVGRPDILLMLLRCRRFSPNLLYG
jgi:hypothetical protein